MRGFPKYSRFANFHGVYVDKRGEHRALEDRPAMPDEELLQGRIDAVFLEALKTPPHEQPAFLDEACRNDPPKIRREVERMLRADGETPLRPAPFPGFQEGAKATAADPFVGRQIGKLVLRRRLGQGGFGVVYLAERRGEFQQKVAVKLIRQDRIADERHLQRFELERQALADLRHEYIAQLLDGGQTEEGAPYLVMEYVEGQPITDYCDAQRLTVQQRIKLFQKVCAAVKHAHDFGYIHRDIKPSNILVTDDGVPKLLDFGIAKLIDPRSRNRLVSLTEEGIPGTPEYASPEQVRGERKAISTATDVYSLGVVLYELLTGHLPYDFKSGVLLEIQRAICEDPPRSPSTVVHQPLVTGREAVTPDAISERRRTNPQRLGKTLGGDLETILLKALHKERQRRYDSPASLADDLDNYSRGLPVEARPDSAVYRARKFVRRNRGAVAAVSLVLFSLVTATIVSNIYRLRAVQLADSEHLAKLEVSEQRELAESRLEYVNEGFDLLVDVFVDLDVDHIEQEGQSLRVVLGNRLAAAAKRVSQLDEDSLTQAEILNELAVTLLSLGYAEEAIPLLEKAVVATKAKLVDDHPDTLVSMNNLADAYESAGRLDEALPLYEKTLAARKAELGDDHPDTLMSMNNLASAYQSAGRLDEAFPLYEKTLAARKAKLGDDHSDTLGSMNNLASAYGAAGRLDEALPLYEKTLAAMKAKLGDDHPNTLTCMNNLASAYQSAGRLDEALRLFEKTLAARKAKLGDDHPNTLISMNILASAYDSAGRLDEALPLLKKTLAARKAKLGDDHPDTLGSMNSLANAYGSAGRLDEALPLYEKTLAATKAKLGDDHPDTLMSMNNLAYANQLMGRFDEALPLYEKTLAATKDKLGDDHPTTLTCMNNLASAYKSAGRLDEALPLYEKTLAATKDKLGDDHPTTLTCMNNLASAYESAGRLDEALPLYEKTLAATKDKLGDDHPTTLTCMNNLASAYESAGRLDEALPLYEKTLAAMKAKLGDDHPNTLTCMNNLASAYESAGRLDEALPLYEQALAAARRSLRGNHPVTQALAEGLRKTKLLVAERDATTNQSDNTHDESDMDGNNAEPVEARSGSNDQSAADGSAGEEQQ